VPRRIQHGDDILDILFSLTTFLILLLDDFQTFNFNVDPLYNSINAGSVSQLFGR